MMIELGISYSELADIIDKGGRNIQSLIAMEECAELSQVVSKLIRYGENEEIHGHLVEEMADVMICLTQLQMMYGVSDDELRNWIERKHNRNLRRIYG